MSGGFVKVYGTILRSSIWLEDPETRILWIALLAMADAEGFVETSVPGLAHAANIPLEACRRGLERLASPDPDSKDPEGEGRRIEVASDGVRVLNYRKYREHRSQRQIQDAKRQRRYRERQRDTSRDSAGQADESRGSRTEVRGQRQSTEDRIQRAEEDQSTSAGADAPRGESGESGGEVPESNAAHEPPARDPGTVHAHGPSPERDVRAVWPQVQAAFAAYAPRGTPTPRALSAARLRAMRARLRELGRPEALVDAVHGYFAFHSRPGPGFSPEQHATPETIYSGKCAKYVEAYEAAVQRGERPPFEARARDGPQQRPTRVERIRQAAERNLAKYGGPNDTLFRRGSG